MRVLVTGAGGFIGFHLCQFLKKQGIKVLGTVLHQEEKSDGVKRVELNLLEKEKVEDLISDFKPDFIFHLAGQTLVMPSWENPEQTLKTNIFTTLYILEAVMKIRLNSRVIIFSSASIYNSSIKKIKENSKLFPNSPYALSKIFVDYLSMLYSLKKGVNIIRIRPFFIIGPGKTSDVVSDFSKRIVQIEKGDEKSLKVGNLEAVRDFVNIEDAIKGIWLIGKRGKLGEVYNLCSGIGYKVTEILKILVSLSTKKIKVVEDKNLFRPVDEPFKVGDNSKLKKLGWKPVIPLEKTLKETLEYWRKL
ncbi:GDP-mannose 4,6-dehydratase [Candidatus Gottesmanbacteria bacterium]|nr:GDP-mannose 4,6-dehydratase [Candidatus Gottesmanbacteria bacterium]